MAQIDRQTVEAEVARVPHWRHRIRLPQGVITPGSQDNFGQLERLGLPADLSGKSVLDIGCSDGFFSFECEKRGATQVVAVDNFSSVYIDKPSGFQIAHRLLESRVELRQADLFDLEPEQIGRFDLVLFLGVLYHLRHPLLGLERASSLCKEQLILESEVVPQPDGFLGRARSGIGGKRHAAWMDFYEHDQVNRDPTNWWVPSPQCVEAMLRSCGFSGVRTVFVFEGRGMFHAFHPLRSNGIRELLDCYGEQFVMRACRELLGIATVPRELESHLINITIPRFGELKQRAAELKAKQWHQDERWRN